MGKWAKHRRHGSDPLSSVFTLPAPTTTDWDEPVLTCEGFAITVSEAFPAPADGYWARYRDEDDPIWIYLPFVDDLYHEFEVALAAGQVFVIQIAWGTETPPPLSDWSNAYALGT